MKLSIITINYNNAEGLRKTIESVLNQTSSDFEYIIVDGVSVDSSLEVFNDKRIVINGQTEFNGIHVNCISERDTGIYNAMNKGIRMAGGEYVQFLNSGDTLASYDVTERMLACLFTPSSEEINILYGNMLKPLPNKTIRDKGFGGKTPTMLDFYTGTLNHSPAYIKRSLFETYGMYDENLKIVSDWKWYMKVIVFNGVTLVYKDIDVTIFDMNGISNSNKVLDKEERKQVLSEALTKSVFDDYNQWAVPIGQLKRINRYWITKYMFWFIERVLFKMEKLSNKFTK